MIRASPARPSRPARAGGGGLFARLGRAVLGLAAATIGLCALAGAGLYLRLAAGPVDLSDAARWVERAAARAAPDVALSIEALSLALAAPGAARLELRATGTTLRDAQGRTLFRAPETRVALRPADLLRGDVRPVAARLIGPSLRLARDASGRFAVALGPADDTGGDSAAEGAAAALAALDAFQRGAPGLFEKLESLAIEDAAFVYADAASGRAIRGARASLTLTREAGGIHADAAFEAPGAAHGRLAATASGRRDPDGAAALTLAFSGAAPADFAVQLPDFAALAILDAALSGALDLEIDADGRLTGFDARLAAGPGAFVVPLGDAAPAERLAFASAALDIGFDPAHARYDIRRAEIAAEGGAAVLAGFVDLESRPPGRRPAAVAQIEIAELALADPRLFAAPVAFDGGRIVARLDLEERRLDVAELHLARGPLRLDARGAATLAESGDWTLDAALEGRDADAEAIKALWPVPAAPGAIAWIRENLDAAKVDRFDVTAALAPDREDFAIAFAFRDAVGHYLRPMPPIEGGAGWGAATLASFGLALSEGRVRAPSGEKVALTEGAFRLPDFDDPRTTAYVEIAGEGPASAILATLDGAPLGLVSKLGLDPRAVGGRAAARAWLTVPLLHDVSLDDVGVDAEATVSDLDLTPPGLALPVRARRATLSVNGAGLRAAGEGALGAAPLVFDWRETFAPAAGAPRSRFAVETRLDDALAAALGFSLAPAMTGAGGLVADIDLAADGAASFDARLDLRDAGLALAPLGWEKRPGAPATARLVGVEAGGLRLDRIEIDAPGLTARGSARLDADGRLAALAFDPLAIGAHTRVALDLRRDGAGFAARLSGPRLDLADVDGLFRTRPREGQAGGGAGGGDAPLAVDIALDWLDTPTGRVLAPATGRATLDARGRIDARLEGRLAGRATLTAVYAGAASGGEATLDAPDGGALLRAAGLFSDAIGGAFSARADVRLDPDFRLAGEARLGPTTIVNDPALARLLAEARLTAAQEALAREGGLDFSGARATFALDAERLRLEELVATGPLLGVRLEGDYDIAADRLDMRGVFTPLYALNSALGALPLLGHLFTGGEGGGLIAFNFTLAGPAENPETSVSVLSGLAPGALRGLFATGGAPPDAEAEATRAQSERNR